MFCEKCVETKRPPCPASDFQYFSCEFANRTGREFRLFFMASLSLFILMLGISQIRPFCHSFYVLRTCRRDSLGFRFPDMRFPSPVLQAPCPGPGIGSAPFSGEPCSDTKPRAPGVFAALTVLRGLSVGPAGKRSYAHSLSLSLCVSVCLSLVLVVFAAPSSCPHQAIPGLPPPQSAAGGPPRPLTSDAQPQATAPIAFLAGLSLVASPSYSEGRSIRVVFSLARISLSSP